MVSNFRRTMPFWELAAVLAAALAAVLLDIFPGWRLFSLLLVLLSAVFFGLAPDARRLRWVRSPLDGLLLALLVQVGVAMWASPLPDKAWTGICQLVAGLVGYYTIVNWSRSRQRLYWAVAALVILGAALTLLAPFAVDWFRNRKIFLPVALYDFFPLLLPDPIHPNVMAGILVTFFPLSLSVWLGAKRSTWLHLGLGAICVLQLVVLVLTKSRGGYMALALGVVLTCWLLKRRRLSVGLALVALALLGFMLAQPASPADADVEEALDASTWAFRQRVWRTAVQIIVDYSLTGVGVGAFNDVAAFSYGFYAPHNPQAHNLLLQVALDLGLPGLGIFVAVLCAAFWAACRACQKWGRLEEHCLQAVTIGGLGGLAATLVHGLVDVHTWGSKGAFIPWLFVGLVFASNMLAQSDLYSEDGDERQIV